MPTSESRARAQKFLAAHDGNRFADTQDFLSDGLAILFDTVRYEEVRSLRIYIHSREKHTPAASPDSCLYQICCDMREREAALQAAAQPETEKKK